MDQRPISNSSNNLPEEPRIESAVIGGVVDHPHMLEAVRVHLRDSDFWTDVYRECWRVLSERPDNAPSIGLIELSRHVWAASDRVTEEELDEAFHLIAANTPRSADEIFSLVTMLRGLSNQRRVVTLAYSMISDAKQGKDPGDILEDVYSAITTIGSATPDHAESIGDMLASYVDEIIKARSEGDSAYLETGIGWADRNIKIGRGHMLVLGAEEKTGKTWMVQQLLRAYAANGYSCGWFSSEMDKFDVGPRVLRSWAGIDWAMERGPEDEQDDAAIRLAIRQYEDLDIRFAYEKHGDNLLRRIAESHRMRPFDLVVVDYLQDFRNPKVWGEMYDGQVELADRLKTWAKRNRVGLLVVSSMNKSGETRKAPTVTQLVGRRRLLHLVDAALLLWRPARKDPNLVQCLLPISRHKQDRVHWYLLRNARSFEFEQISSSDAKGRMKEDD